MHSKKAQVTVFIILGLVIFIIAMLVVYMRVASVQQPEDQSLRRTPSTFEDYIETCLDVTAEDAIKTIGSQGGYAVLPDFIRLDEQGFISLDKNKVFGIPSWYYKGEYRIPTISSMEEDISYYVETHMASCLRDFDDFTDNYEVTVKGDGNASTSITDTNVLVLYEYPVEVTTKNDAQTQTFSKFQVSVPVQLGKMRELAKRITYAENNGYFFEKEIIDMMSADGDVPITGLDVKCIPHTWSAGTVQQEIMKDIFYNLQRVRFKDTAYAEFDAPESDYEQFADKTLLDLRAGNIPDNNPADSYEFFQLFFDPNELPKNYDPEPIDFSQIRAGVKFYPDNYFSFRVRPSAGDMMKSQFAKFPGTDISFMCLQTYHFTYDINFLLEIDLYEESAFYDDGFLFRFAVPVNIKSNEPTSEDPGFLNVISQPTFFENSCDDLEGSYDIRVNGLFMGLENIELPDAEVDFDCVKFGCKLGTTKNDGGIYRLVTGLPKSCTNGFLSVRKDGYLPVKVQHLGEEDVVINMRKVKDYQLEVNLAPQQQTGSSELEDGEMVLVQIIPYDYDDSIVAQVSADGTSSNVTLVEDYGNYYIDAMLVDVENDRVLGGYKGNFTYDYSDSAGRDTLVIPIPSFEAVLPFTGEQQMEIINYINEGTYREEWTPRFS